MVTTAMKLKSRLLLEIKAMTNLDSMLKSRDITLLTKVHLIKAMAFPVVIYGCQSWTIKKAEHAIKRNAFESVLMRWMNLEPIIRREVSQKEKNKHRMLMHTHGI